MFKKTWDIFLSFSISAMKEKLTESTSLLRNMTNTNTVTHLVSFLQLSESASKNIEMKTN